MVWTRGGLGLPPSRNPPWAWGWGLAAGGGPFWSCWIGRDATFGSASVLKNIVTTSTASQRKLRVLVVMFTLDCDAMAANACQTG